MSDDGLCPECLESWRECECDERRADKASLASERLAERRETR